MKKLCVYVCVSQHLNLGELNGSVCGGKYREKNRNRLGVFVILQTKLWLLCYEGRYDSCRGCNKHLNLTLTHFGYQKPAENVPHAVCSNKKGRHNAAVAGACEDGDLQSSANDE